ncbi:MAG: glycine--tRNA ligase subunit beta [Desulfovibrionales bacterium]
MAFFVLEVGTEELPARFVPNLLNELQEKFVSRIRRENIAFGKADTSGTPRRLSLTVQNLAEYQEQEEQVITGPPAQVALGEDGSPTKAGLGFARSQGVDFSDTFLKETEKGSYLAARKTIGGAATGDLLPEICTELISSLSFPKKMRWTESDFAFGRPIRWILALLDEREVPFTLAEVKSGRETFGHLIMAPRFIPVERADAYDRVLRETGRVILEPEKRREIILHQGNELAGKEQGEVIWNEGLLDQVVNLVEFPVPVLGGFDPSFLELPREVLLTSMETHQKSFGVKKQGSNDLQPFFLTTLNVEPKDLDVVRTGWEKVLRARLEDARFFWETDLRCTLSEWLNKLDQAVFLGPLGSMGQKSARLASLCTWLAAQVAPEKERELSRAGLLAKTDLVSEMVGEFPDLQGVMGGIYARKQGEPETVSQGIYEHYLPVGHDSPVPDSVEGGLLSIADKTDTLVGCFGLDMIPTGTADPYALRRHALGVCRIILDHGIRLSLRELLGRSFAAYHEVAWKHPAEKIASLLEDFFAQRLRSFFQSEGFETRQVEAALGGGFDDILVLSLRLQALKRFSARKDFEQSVLTFKRAGNIIQKQGQIEKTPLDGNVNAKLLTEEAEKELFAKILEIEPRFESSWKQEKFEDLFELLAELRPNVDSFFDHVMVMCEDPALRRNRLNILHRLVTHLKRLADFSALQV